MDGLRIEQCVLLADDAPVLIRPFVSRHCFPVSYIGAFFCCTQQTERFQDDRRHDGPPTMTVVISTIRRRRELQSVAFGAIGDPIGGIKLVRLMTVFSGDLMAH